MENEAKWDKLLRIKTNGRDDTNAGRCNFISTILRMNIFLI